MRSAAAPVPVRPCRSLPFRATRRARSEQRTGAVPKHSHGVLRTKPTTRCGHSWPLGSEECSKFFSCEAGFDRTSTLCFLLGDWSNTSFVVTSQAATNVHFNVDFFEVGLPCKGTQERPTVEVLLLEGAEILAGHSSDEAESEAEATSLKEVVVELLRQEMRSWDQLNLPILLLIPWASAQQPLDLQALSLALPVPLGSKQREEVLRLCLNTELESEADLAWLADITGGFLPSDLSALCRAAAVAAARTCLNQGVRPKLSRQHFQLARAATEPSSSRGTCAVKLKPCALPDLAWQGLDAVIGQDAVVIALQSTVVEPFKCMQKEEQNCIEPPIGVLLSGCPGSGKSFLAVQLATELSAQLFQAGPADLLASRVGDAEKHVASLFSSARGCTPSIVVLEDIDGLLPSPGIEMDEGSAETCISYVLRKELDTIKARRHQHQKLRAGEVCHPQASEALMLVVGTTVVPNQLPPWLCSSHRFSRHLQLQPALSQKDERLQT